MTKTETIRLKTIHDLARATRELARRLKPGDHLGLIGPLGAGKTAFVQALAQALGAVERPTSPTFTLRQTIRCGESSKIRELIHADLYRLEDARQVAELGVKDDLARPNALVVVEWIDHAPDLIPKMRYLLRFAWDYISVRYLTIEKRTTYARDGNHLRDGISSPYLFTSFHSPRRCKDVGVKRKCKISREERCVSRETSQ